MYVVVVVIVLPLSSSRVASPVRVMSDSVKVGLIPSLTCSSTFSITVPGQNLVSHQAVSLWSAKLLSRLHTIDL